MTDISVIIPMFNAEDTIKACVNSVLQQTVAGIEIVIVDDGSQDNSHIICQDIAEGDARVRLLRQTNQGPAAARAKGLKEAIGQWIAFVDADDRLPSSALAKLRAAATDDTDIVFGHGTSLSHEHRTQIPINDFRHMAVRGDGRIGVPWGSLFRKAALPANAFDLPTDIRVGEDYIFWLRMVFATQKPVHVLYDNVYDKCAEHISASFKWTAEYAEAFNTLRMQAIPCQLHEQYIADTLSDRITNLFDIAVAQPSKTWKQSAFYKSLLHDMQTQGITFSPLQRAFLALPSLRLRQLCSAINKYQKA